MARNNLNEATLSATIATELDEYGEEIFAVIIEVDTVKGDWYGPNTYRSVTPIETIDEGVALVRKWCVDRNLQVPQIYYIGNQDPMITFWIHTHASELDTRQERQGLVG